MTRKLVEKCRNQSSNLDKMYYLAAIKMGKDLVLEKQGEIITGSRACHLLNNCGKRS